MTRALSHLQLHAIGLHRVFTPRRRLLSNWRRAGAVLSPQAAGRQDQVLRTISDNGQVSVLVVEGTRLVQEACSRHKSAPTASAALGRALLGTLLMGCFREEGEKTQVRRHA